MNIGGYTTFIHTTFRFTTFFVGAETESFIELFRRKKIGDGDDFHRRVRFRRLRF